MITLQSRDLRASLEERETYLRSLVIPREDCVLVQTCNRVELYRGDGDVPADIARHLFRVVAGLESALVGEAAIQGQVKEAYERAREGGALSPALHRLFQHALRTGKRVRTETGISRGAISHGTAVLEVIRQDRIDVRSAKILIIGVNNLNASVVQYLTERGNRTVFIANRTWEKARLLAGRYGAEAVRFDRLREHLKDTDVLVSATSAPHLILRKEDFAPDRPVTLFDLAVPRDIDPSLGSHPLVTLYNIEDIECRIAENRDGRVREIRDAERIIDEEIGRFYTGFPSDGRMSS